VCHLRLKKFHFIGHATHVLLAFLSWHDQRVNQKFTVLLDAAQDGACLDLAESIGMRNFEEFSDYFDWTNDCFQASC